MELSYQEKSIWASLIATVVVYGRYFLMRPQGYIVATVVLLVIVQIVGQTAIAVAYRSEPKDERDRAIEAKAYRVGYFLLVTGIIVCMNVGGHATVNALLMALVASEIGKSITQLISYRRGA